MPPSREGIAQDEGALVAATRLGSADALAQLYHGHADAVYGVAYRLISVPEDAEDVLQDVFVGLPDALQNYDERGNFGAWLRRVTVRAALMHLRARGRRREEALDDHGEVPSNATGQLLIDRIAAREAILRLPDALRTVFVLKEVEGYSHAEIALLLGLTPGASAVRLNRAWRALFRQVEGR
jgi:RNA polymerase sigma factor (sigma-70 family)